jgi:hypothetical protein
MHFVILTAGITSDLAAVFWRLSRMAITNDLPSVFCWVSQMASSLISSSIRNPVGIKDSSLWSE